MNKEKLAIALSKISKSLKNTASSILESMLESLYKWDNEDPFVTFEALYNKTNRKSSKKQQKTKKSKSGS